MRSQWDRHIFSRSYLAILRPTTCPKQYIWSRETRKRYLGSGHTSTMFACNGNSPHEPDHNSNFQHHSSWRPRKESPNKNNRNTRNKIWMISKLCVFVCPDTVLAVVSHLRHYMCAYIVHSCSFSCPQENSNANGMQQGQQKYLKLKRFSFIAEIPPRPVLR